MAEGRILVVDDDPSLRTVVRLALERAGFTVVEVADGRAALAAAIAEAPDLMVLDIGMPELDGTEVCREIRRTSSLPIVFLSSADSEIDRVLGLELGGDDYLTKPFSPRELVARVKAVLRRVRPDERVDVDRASDASQTRTHRGLTLDRERMRVWAGETEVMLTATEFSLLETLLRRPGRVWTRDALMDDAYGPSTVVSDRTIDSHVRRIRQKLGEYGALLETVHGVGYRLAE